jgi:hypothetical protein
MRQEFLSGGALILFPSETAKTTRASRRRTESEATAQSMELKRQDGAEFNSGETLHGLSKRRDICRNLIRVWIAKTDARESAAELLATYEVRISTASVPGERFLTP